MAKAARGERPKAKLENLPPAIQTLYKQYVSTFERAMELGKELTTKADDAWNDANPNGIERDVMKEGKAVKARQRVKFSAEMGWLYYDWKAWERKRGKAKVTKDLNKGDDLFAPVAAGIEPQEEEAFTQKQQYSELSKPESAEFNRLYNAFERDGGLSGQGEMERYQFLIKKSKELSALLA